MNEIDICDILVMEEEMQNLVAKKSITKYQSSHILNMNIKDINKNHFLGHPG